MFIQILGENLHDYLFLNYNNNNNKKKWILSKVLYWVYGMPIFSFSLLFYVVHSFTVTIRLHFYLNQSGLRVKAAEG